MYPHFFPSVPRAGIAGVLFAHVLLPASMALSQPPDPGRTGLPLSQLRAVYLGCEAEALSSRMGTGDVMGCSVVYEDLKARAFGGDFRALRRWFDAQPLPGLAPADTLSGMVVRGTLA